MNKPQQLIASRFQMRFARMKTAEPGELVIFQRSSRPDFAFGIVVDGMPEAKEDPITRGVVPIEGDYQFLDSDDLNVMAVMKGPWQFVPDIRRMQYRSPQPGDLMVSMVDGVGMGFVHALQQKWCLLQLSSAESRIWRSDREAIVMPWRLMSGADVLYDPATPKGSK